ncbi:MAG: hypothetical protein JXR31_03040 [Prolixibacteraceae bacterium]|nr:hypothetical protein [Prolixibacteraceae bacterium]MBN2773199.1 hypothetical protein [Prolixibacteraceae bacterium]
MKRHIQILFIFILIAASFNFFEATFLPENVGRYAQFFFGLIAIAVSIPFVFIKWEGFIFPVLLLIVSMAISILTTYLSWNQGFVDSIKATVPFMLWIFVFYMLKAQIRIKTVENIALVYTGIYFVLYIFQLLNSGKVYFGVHESFAVDRGIVRIIFPGSGIFFLGVFIALNRLTLKNTNKLIWAPIALIGLLVPVLQVTRQLIATILFIYLLHITRKLDYVKKAVIVFTFLAVIVFVSTSNLSIIKGLKGVQEETVSQGSEYIRVKMAKYYLTEFSPDMITRILGNGFPYGDKTDYGKAHYNLAYTKDYYLTDVGIVAVYILFGIFAIAAYLMIWYKSFRYKVPENYLYLKYYIWFLLFTCLTSDNMFSYNYLIATVFAIYIFQRIYIREKNREKMIDFLKNLVTRKEALA